jgi:hypothetical protein
VSTIGLERELGRDSELARDIERRAGLGNVSDCAIDRAAAEMNAAAFQHAMPVCDPVFLVHPLKSQNVEIPAFRFSPLKRPVLFHFPPEMIKLPKRLLTIYLHPEVVAAGGSLASILPSPEYQNRKLAGKLASLFDIVKGFQP